MENTEVKDLVTDERSIKEVKSKIDSEFIILKNMRRLNSTWICVWIVVLAITIIERVFYSHNASIWQSIISISALIIALLGLIVQSSNFDKNQKRQFELGYRKTIIDDESFINDIKELNQEERALRQLAKKQSDLDRYHALNLSHTKSVFLIGVIIIFLGIIIIMTTLVLALFNYEYVDTVIIISGFIGGILVDAIGAVFIAMYTKTIDSATKYQASLVETANTYLGNVLASQILEQNLREQTLSEMAKELVHVEQKNN